MPYDQPGSNGQEPIDMVRGNLEARQLLFEWAAKAQANAKEL